MKCLTYLGNKRKILDKIYNQVKQVAPTGLILDLFSGSGVVSWYLRDQGYTVHANDIAKYSYHINVANLEYTPEIVQVKHPYLREFIASLNVMDGEPVEKYFSKYYSENPEAKYQRLYYTRRNGIFLDNVLGEIHRRADLGEQSLVLADLLYKMSKHTNTNGHFKTFHKAFGGLTNKHDVERITMPILIDYPEPSNGPVGKAFCLDASTLLEESDVHYAVVYCDPPYNQHQYSANYHLLEAACLPFNKRYTPKESQISGIDSKLYKSPYCSKMKCLAAFTQMMDLVREKADAAVISYNAKGFIDLDTMQKTLTRYGQVYTEPIQNKYRIGTRRTGTAKKPEREVIEYLFRVTW